MFKGKKKVSVEIPKVCSRFSMCKITGLPGQGLVVHPANVTSVRTSSLNDGTKILVQTRDGNLGILGPYSADEATKKVEEIYDGLNKALLG